MERTPILGAGIGAIVGGGASIISQLWSGNDINWTDVGKATVTGAVAGAIIGTGVGAVAALGGLAEAGAGGIYVTYGAGLASGIAGEATSQSLDMLDGSREALDYDLPEIAKSGVIGGALNVVTAGLGQALKKPLSDAVGKLVQGTPTREAVATAQKTAGREAKSAGLGKKGIRAARSSAKKGVYGAANQRVATVTQTTLMTAGTSAKKSFTSFIDSEKNKWEWNDK